MKVRMRLDVDAQTRYIIARYFKDAKRPRATRLQVQRFTLAALRTAVREQLDLLPKRQRAVAQRLGAPQDARETLAEPREKQRSLAW